MHSNNNYSKFPLIRYTHNGDDTFLLCHHWPTGPSLVAIHMHVDFYSRYGVKKLVTLRPHMRSTTLAECRMQTVACDIPLVY